MWAALLGAAVGGFLALAADVSVEVRRDRRREIAGARLVLAEFRRSFLEIDMVAAYAQALLGRHKLGELGEDELDDEGWFHESHAKIRLGPLVEGGSIEGPLARVRGDAWFAHEQATRFTCRTGTLRVVRVRDDDADQAPVLVVEDLPGSATSATD